MAQRVRSALSRLLEMFPSRRQKPSGYVEIPASLPIRAKLANLVFGPRKGPKIPDPTPKDPYNPNNPKGYLHSEAEAKQLFDYWCKKHGRSYPSIQEKLYRYGVFKDNLEKITRENMRCSKGTRFSTNFYADATPEELDAHFFSK